MNRILRSLLVISLLVAAVYCSNKGEARLKILRERANRSPNKIINFDRQDFRDLWPEYEYTATLYNGAGMINTEKNPTFFVRMQFSNDFNFNSAPNLVVSKPHMAVVSEIEKKKYIQSFKWIISYSDGHVTTHKMLEFINKRTDKDVLYKPPFTTMITMFFGFISVAAVGAFVFIKLKMVWTNWIVWFVGSILIYVTCVSGVVYDIIHDVPFVGRDRKTGQVMVFADGNREQYGAEGLVISLIIMTIGLLFISILVMGEKLNKKSSFIGSVIALIIIFMLVNSLQSTYKSKSWYGPSFRPPGGYLTGPISNDQGTNI